jgi:hypothetical protein
MGVKLDLSHREEHRLRVFEDRVLRKICGPKRDEVTGSGEDYIMRSFMSCTSYQILLGTMIKSKVMRWVGHVALWWRG